MNNSAACARRQIYERRIDLSLKILCGPRRLREFVYDGDVLEHTCAVAKEGDSIRILRLIHVELDVNVAEGGSNSGKRSGQIRNVIIAIRPRDRPLAGPVHRLHTRWRALPCIEMDHPEALRHCQLVCNLPANRRLIPAGSGVLTKNVTRCSNASQKWSRGELGARSQTGRLGLSHNMSVCQDLPSLPWI